MNNLEKEAINCLKEYITDLLKPYFGSRISSQGLFAFFNEDNCLFTPQEGQDIYVILSEDGEV